MGFGATPHKKDARGAAPNPASFLKRKRERRISRKLCFRQGDYRFCESALLLGRRIWDFPEIHFRLTDGKVLSKNFTYPKPYLSPEKNGVFLLSKVFGVFRGFFQKASWMGHGATPHRRGRSAGLRPEPRLFLEKKEGKKNKPKTLFSAGGL